jgi:DNA-binding NtrC family response regulator
MKFLLVDDEESLRRNLAALLLDQIPGCSVIEAATGREGLELLKQDQGISIVITDYHMPEMNGLQLLQEAARLPKLLGKGYIIASGDYSVPILVEKTGLGSSLSLVFLDKPYKFESMLEAIKRLSQPLSQP